MIWWSLGQRMRDTCCSWIGISTCHTEAPFDDLIYAIFVTARDTFLDLQYWLISGTASNYAAWKCYKFSSNGLNGPQLNLCCHFHALPAIFVLFWVLVPLAVVDFAYCEMKDSIYLLGRNNSIDVAGQIVTFFELLLNDARFLVAFHFDDAHLFCWVTVWTLLVIREACVGCRGTKVQCVGIIWDPPSLCVVSHA